MSTYSDLILSEPGLVSAWFTRDTNTTAFDSKGTNAGTYTGGYTQSVQGPLPEVTGGAVTFNGTTGFITVPDANSLDLGDGPFSLEVWAKRGTTTAGQSLIGKGTGAYLLWIEFLSAGLELRKVGTGSVMLCSPTGAITDTAAWHHVVVTRALATNPLMYLDGADCSLNATYNAATFVNNALALNIGASAGGSFWNGSVACPAIYNTVLTPAQIQNHYQIGQSVNFNNPAGYGVAVSNQSFQVAAENDARRRLILTNDSDTVIYCTLASTGAAVGRGIRLEPNGGWRTLDYYLGPVSAIVNSTTPKNLLVAEEV